MYIHCLFVYHRHYVSYSIGCLSPESLYSALSSTQDSFVHFVPIGSIRNDVFCWLLTLALSWDGFPHHRDLVVALQVRIYLRYLWDVDIYLISLFLTLFDRHKIVPCVIDNKYLEALDGENQ